MPHFLSRPRVTRVWLLGQETQRLSLPAGTLPCERPPLSVCAPVADPSCSVPSAGLPSVLRMLFYTAPGDYGLRGWRAAAQVELPVPRSRSVNTSGPRPKAGVPVFMPASSTGHSGCSTPSPIIISHHFLFSLAAAGSAASDWDFNVQQPDGEYS